MNIDRKRGTFHNDKGDTHTQILFSHEKGSFGTRCMGGHQGHCVLVAQLCLTLCDCTDCSPPGSSVLEILQTRTLEWVVIFFSRGSSQPRDRTQVSHITGRLFTVWATKEAIEGIMISEISQTETDKHHMISLIHEIWKTNPKFGAYRTD